MSRPAILIVEQSSELGGSQLGLLDLLPAFQAEFSPHVLAPGPGPLTNRLERLGVPWSGWPLGDYGFGSKTASEVLRFAARFPACVSRLAAEARRVRARLLLANGPRAFPAAAAAARLCRIPSVWQLHLELASGRDRILCRIWARLARPAVLTCSRACLEVFPPASLLRRTARVIYPGVRAVPQPSVLCTQHSVVIGVIGRIHPDKGQDQLLRAAPRILDVFPDARFRLIGEWVEGHSYRRQLAALAEPLGPGAVEFRGWADDVPAELAQLAVLVAPSRREALARVVLEAFAARVPVVAAAVGGIPEVVQPEVTGLLYPPGDEAALAAAVLRVLEDAPLRRRLTEQAYRDFLSRWTLERFQGEMLAVLREKLSMDSTDFTDS